jgi:predicted O-methyltransferase YrrM
MSSVTINNFEYQVNKNEFEIQPHDSFTNLKIRRDVGRLERIISLLKECAKSLNITNLLVYNTNCGGFLPIQCSSFFEKIFLVETFYTDCENIFKNVENCNIKSKNRIENIFISKYLKNFQENMLPELLLYSEESPFLDTEYIKKKQPLLLTVYCEDLSTIYGKVFKLSKSNLVLYVPDRYIYLFTENFKYYIKNDNVLEYDNLNHLCIIVKNAGPQFEEMLLKNIDHFDRWTILDTGSEDETIETINRVLIGKKKGELFQEPFINFRDTRNRCFELAGTECKFLTMLDDTYIVNGNLREFLNQVRGDQYSKSFSVYIKTNDTTYSSNRIIKSESGLRYKFKIHEVITEDNNNNVLIPINIINITDLRFDYMEKRTMDRKEFDLKLLYEELADDPMNPRTYYYLGHTYNLLKKYEKAYFYFQKRCEFLNRGYHQEFVDALLESARIANFHLNKPWEECEKMYNTCYHADESRCDALYFIGSHYYNENNYQKAYTYFKKAFEKGYPIHTQYALKPTLSFYFLPIFLAKICYCLNDYKLGKKACELFLKHNSEGNNSYTEIQSWNKIYEKLSYGAKSCKKINVPEKPIFCFHADGGFNYWSGKNIYTTGVGGSETYIIEMSRHIQKSGLFNVFVFCNCVEEEICDGVTYKPLDMYYDFIKLNYIHTCVVSRYSEYLPVTFKGYTENVYLVVHDLTPSCNIIPLDNKLKKIFCLTEWHTQLMSMIFPALKEMLVTLYYGVDFNKFKNDANVMKQPNKFIYSSFANRGLLQLLQMWPQIYEFQPDASLHIYCDLENAWVNRVEPKMMKQIKKLLFQTYNIADKKTMNIHYYGWVNKETLSFAWLTSDIWFYPCTFKETFCLTALEAAITKTFVITNDLAALQNTVSDRGILIRGDATDETWQKTALETIKKYLSLSTQDLQVKQELIEKNYRWASELSWENQSNTLLKEHILPIGKYEYKDMYNWVSDVPTGSKNVFLEIIEYFNKTYCAKINKKEIHVLEIGTYTGTSIIHILENIPNSHATCIDRWEDYTENGEIKKIEELGIKKSFHKNIQTANLENRVEWIKGDSCSILLDMVKREKYDFIYVDGCHLLLDCYTDLILSWQLLNSGGILAIDDYCFNSDGSEPLQSPFESVNHFLKKYDTEIKILHKGYRVFLEKK